MAWGGSIGVFAALSLALSGTSQDAAEPGHLQVKTKSGVTVRLAQRSAIAEDEHGVTFHGLAPGAHRLVATRDGYLDQTSLVRVRAGEVTVHRLAPWQKFISSTGRAAIVVQTLPVDATISAQALGYEKVAKGDDDFVIPHVPAGRHKLTFCTEYKCIDYRVEVGDGDLVKLLVLFDPGEVEDVSRAFRARVDNTAKACLRTREMDACTEACTLATRLAVPSPTCRITSGAFDFDMVDSPEPGAPGDGAVPATSGRRLPLAPAQ